MFARELKMISPDPNALSTLEFCSSICKDVPTFMDVVPSAECDFGDCHNNIDRVIARHGGEPVRGWHLMEWPGVFIEAEQHVVWKSPHGSVVDPTPHLIGFTKILFLPDRSIGEWDFLPNRKKALCDDRLIIDFLEASTARQHEQSPLVVARFEQAYQRLVARYGQEPVPVPSA